MDWKSINLNIVKAMFGNKQVAKSFYSLGGESYSHIEGVDDEEQHRKNTSYIFVSVPGKSTNLRHVGYFFSHDAPMMFDHSKISLEISTKSMHKIFNNSILFDYDCELMKTDELCIFNKKGGIARKFLNSKGMQTWINAEYLKDLGKGEHVFFQDPKNHLSAVIVMENDKLVKLIMPICMDKEYSF